MLRIWEKYFFKEIFKVFFLFLAVFYGLYTLIDYTSHVSSAGHQHSHLHFGEFFLHYFCEFVVRAEILVPFALLIASVKVLCQLNQNNELIALLAAGYSKRRLLAPFISLGFLITALLFLNSEFLLPKATKRLLRLDEKYSREKSVNKVQSTVHQLTLEDGTTLLFMHWNPALEQFEEALWIRSIDEVWRMPRLKPRTAVPQGEFIDILKRSPKGLLTVAASFETKEIPEMLFNKKRLIETITPPDELALSELVQKLPQESRVKSEKEARILTAFYRKLALPFLPLLAVIGVAPFCMQFSRRLAVFFIYAGSIFGLVAIYIVINAAAVLGERQVLEPFTAIFAPFTFFAALFIFRFFRMK